MWKSDAAIPSPAPKKTRTALTDFIRRGRHSEARVHINREWHHSQVVRQRSAKPSFSSSSLDGASKNKGGIRRMPPLSFLKRKQNRQAGMAELADAERDVPGACAEHTRKSRTLKIHKNAGMAELADARDLKSLEGDFVSVRARFSAPVAGRRINVCLRLFFAARQEDFSSKGLKGWRKCAKLMLRKQRVCDGL